jgi:protein ImuA
MTESRRFPLAAEGASNIGLIIRRWRRHQEATDFGNPTASATRWRVSSIPSQPLPVPGVGKPRWLLELMRARGSDSRDWTVEACDQRGLMRLTTETSGADSWNADVEISGWGA